MTTCCGEDRTTPFCPACGKKLNNPSPLVEIRDYCGSNLRRAERLARELATNQYRKAEAEKAKVSAAKWKRWRESLDAAMGPVHTSGKIYADWLEENGHVEAARALRGAFS